MNWKWKSFTRVLSGKLKDFYSHSNWIELGNTEPCTALINLEENIPNPAGNSVRVYT